MTLRPAVNAWFVVTLSWFLLAAWAGRRPSVPAPAAQEAVAEVDALEAALREMDARDPEKAAQVRAALGELDRFKGETGIDLRPDLEMRMGPVMSALVRENLLKPTRMRDVWGWVAGLARDNASAFRRLWMSAAAVAAAVAVLGFLSGNRHVTVVWLDTVYLGVVSLVWVLGALFLAVRGLWGFPLAASIPAEMWRVPLLLLFAAALASGRLSFFPHRGARKLPRPEPSAPSFSETYGGEVPHAPNQGWIDRLLERWLGQ